MCIHSLQPTEIVGEAASGEAAVELVSRLMPDLVVIDMSMPTMSGLEAIRQIRKVSKKPRIILVSVDALPNLAEQALEAGADGCSDKLYLLQSLIPQIRSFFDHLKPRRESLADGAA
jgi:DNA-binding NarL/FixJ family response regulator